MSPETVALARHRLTLAGETVAEGEALLERGALRGAINRFYYAAFYAARALLSLQEIDSSKHTGVIALFQRHFVKSGIISVDVARALQRAFERRLETDYGDYATLSLEETQRTRDEVQRFVHACSDALERLSTDTKGDGT